MALLEALLGSPPPRYDAHHDHAAIPDYRREKTLKSHVEECAKRYAELRTALQDQAIEQFQTRRLIWAVIGLLVANKAIDVSAIAAVFAH